jgi:predicted porin
MKMKKLLTSAAVCGLAAFAAMPAHAASDGLKLDVGGYFKGYAVYTSQDDDSAVANTRKFDILRNTEIHLGGETTLDNGLTVGYHLETEADGSDTNGPNDSFLVNESYAYFSGGWGRVNFGSEDGAAYLLQVEAPSADSNIDGLRQFINPVRYAGLNAAGTLAPLNVAASGSAGGLDYDQDVSGNADKFTYLSPIMSGFQVGISYTPDVANASTENLLNTSNVVSTFGSVWDFGGRYEGQFDNVGVILGGGYTVDKLEQKSAAANPGAGVATDDRKAWNLGADLTFGPFGVGAAYMHDNHGNIDTAAAGIDTINSEKTWVVGADYTTGPWKLGASYLHSNAPISVVGTSGTNGTDGISAKRWTGGVTYTYGPGMTFRGSISRVDLNNVAGITGGGDSPSATSVLLGTQVNF